MSEVRRAKGVHLTLEKNSTEAGTVEHKERPIDSWLLWEYIDKKPPVTIIDSTRYTTALKYMHNILFT